MSSSTSVYRQQDDFEQVHILGSSFMYPGLLVMRVRLISTDMFERLTFICIPQYQVLLESIGQPVMGQISTNRPHRPETNHVFPPPLTSKPDRVHMFLLQLSCLSSDWDVS